MEIPSREIDGQTTTARTLLLNPEFHRALSIKFQASWVLPSHQTRLKDGESAIIWADKKGREIVPIDYKKKINCQWKSLIPKIDIALLNPPHFGG